MEVERLAKVVIDDRKLGRLPALPAPDVDQVMGEVDVS
jgi:hypothetical protein